jgi:glucose-fructose oxidoreductase
MKTKAEDGMEKIRAEKTNDHAHNGVASKRVRYALVALGNIAQTAVLPGFLNAKENSELAAFVSDDPKKLKKLASQYNVENCYSYGQYDECLRSGKIDAVYIALPNHLHCEFAVRAAEAGIHVLSEKPLALDECECVEMIRACEDNGVKLMTAYRLHFERGNLEAIKIIRSGKIGEPRYFNSTFSMQVKKGVRTCSESGGGTLYDIGIYCINAARYLFQADPCHVFAFSTSGKDKRFEEVDEMTAATLRFPGKKLASFICSFGAADTAAYEVVGTKGTLRVTQAYEFSEPIKMEIKVGEKTTRRSFAKRDQFGPEIIYFSDCILKDREPEPSGSEGLVDVHVIRSLYESARQGKAVCLERFSRRPRPNLSQEIHRPAREPLELVHTEAPNE